MRVKLTAKHPRPASSERAPVRSGSSTARKPTRSAAPADKPAAPKAPRGSAGASAGAPAARRGSTTSSDAPRRPAPRSNAAGAPAERRGPSSGARNGASARSEDRPARPAGAGSRERSDSGSFERRPAGDRPPRAAGAGSRERGAPGSYERRPAGDRPARKEGASAGTGFRRDAEARADRRTSSDRPPRGDRPAGSGERAPRFSRDDDARGARRAPRENDDGRRGPRTARGAEGAPSHERTERRYRDDATEGRAPRAPRGDRPDVRGERAYARPARPSYEDRGATPEGRPRGEGAPRRARSGDTEARGERTYAKPVKAAYAERASDAPPKTTPRATKARRDARPVEDSFDRPARFDRPAEKTARKARPAAAPRQRDEGEFNDAPGNLRLSKLMSELGLCSRREADEWIEKGWVTVDGVVVDTLGTKVRPDADIQIDPAAQAAQQKQVTILVHKPVGYVSGQAEDGYEPAVTLVKPENRWEGDRTDIRFSAVHLRQLAPAGRLDIDSTGLLVLTQDGRIAKQLIGGHSEIDKEYLVRVSYGDVETDVEHEFPAESLAKLRHGLELDGVPLKPAMVSWQNGEQLRFVLREGKKRQIRRMCELVGLHVVGLKRVRMGHVMLGALPPGQWRYLGPDEAF
ncbi:pseudouridine synthase [Paraburkholderia azotifigens]|uniref:Dual-specificity RNA pseudouridine synthase RluF n=1 Tax=Paraburkholderia azotifigens TaxID=2057004 RepID=A0ABU9R9V2_9BURK|nr:pseudouridine synthase [Paraburkholderia azotifigens]